MRDAAETACIREGLHILDGSLDALDRMDAVNIVVRSSSDRPAAMRGLQSPPFGYSEAVANHLLDLTVGKQTVTAIERLRQERQGAVKSLEGLISGSSLVKKLTIQEQGAPVRRRGHRY